MPKNTPLPVPLERWFNDVKKVEELREVLDNETYQTAVATLKEIAGPTLSGISSNNDENGQRYSWYAGYRDAFNDLFKLTRLKQDKPVVEPEEWKHIQTPQ
tara:strand:+ start:3387 stop:3689 length:303 start_codon:yes stop_codon:yes gene_type:complete